MPVIKDSGIRARTTELPEALGETSLAKARTCMGISPSLTMSVRMEVASTTGLLAGDAATWARGEFSGRGAALRGKTEIARTAQAARQNTAADSEAIKRVRDIRTSLTKSEMRSTS